MSRYVTTAAVRLAVLAAASTLFTAAAGQAQTVNGQLGVGEYKFTLASQVVATGFGNNVSQLDAFYANVYSDGTIGYFIAGNFENNGNKFVTLIDNGRTGAVASTDAQGYGTWGNVVGQSTYHFGNRGGSAPGSVTSPGFNPRYALVTNLFGDKYYQDLVNLTSDNPSDYYLQVAPDVNGAPWRARGASGTATATSHNYALNNTAGNSDANLISAYDDNNVNASSNFTPLNSLFGYEANYTPAFTRQRPGTSVKILVYLAGSGGSDYLSNQFLPSLAAGTGNLAFTDNNTPRFDVRAPYAANPLFPSDKFYLTIPTPTAAASGTWADNANWSTGYAPNGINTQAAFDSTAAARNITVFSSTTVGTIYLSGSNGVTIDNSSSGGSDLILSTYAGDRTVVRSTSGNHTITGTLKLASSVDAEIPTGSSLTVTNITATTPGAGLKLSNGGKLSVGSYAAGPLEVTSGLVDLSGQALVSGSTLPAVSSLVASWWNNGSRTGSGLGNSAADGLTTLAVLLNDDGTGTVRKATFAGATAGLTDVLVATTYIGDTNLSGSVDSADLGNLIKGIRNGLTGWANGDTNYDGVVNGIDYANLVFALRNQGTAFSFEDTATVAGVTGTGIIPEPSALGLLLPAGALLARRRR